MTAKDALTKIFEEDTLASPDELIAALDAAGYVIVPKHTEAAIETLAVWHDPANAALVAEIKRLMADMQEIASQCHNLPRSATADRIDQIARRALERGK